MAAFRVVGNISLAGRGFQAIGGTGCLLPSRAIKCRAILQAGQSFRVRNGLGRSGNEYGPLTDLPDWSYTDGRPAPLTARKLKRERKRNAISNRVKRLMMQVDEAQLKEVYEELGLDYNDHLVEEEIEGDNLCEASTTKSISDEAELHHQTVENKQTSEQVSKTETDTKEPV